MREMRKGMKEFKEQLLTFCLNAKQENKLKYYFLSTSLLNCQKLLKIVPSYDFSSAITNISSTEVKDLFLRDYQLADVKFLSRLKISNLLIVTPSILQQQWQKSVEDEQELVIIISKDTFKIDSSYFKKLKKKQVANVPYCVIVDEAHFLRNHQSQQSKSIYVLKDAPYKMALTGTPKPTLLIENLPNSIFTSINQKFVAERKEKWKDYQPLEILANLKTLTLYPPALGFEGTEPLAEALAKKKIATGLIIGKTNFQEREENIRRFQSGELGILLCNIQSAGVGLNLSRAETIIFADRSYSPADNEQAEARFLPTTGNEPSQVRLVIDLICQGTIDEKILQLLKKKEDIIRVLSDNPSYFFT
ncbi:16636_t:CDS:2 [Funneliformis geosporum]|uniref:16636_t:CDS:1 n=1 Tax=Funneliformis geosporum TaxID=1117311 RepID=A0A9W4SD64_9GLOM|nr:16636_t:CDS:2 [Funneliformis geosporum]